MSEELAYVEAYLHIERIRRASCVSWQLHAEPATLMKRVPTLILLPLVENAITHGAPAGEGLPIHVTIEARERFEDLVLRVTNSCAPRAATDRAACTGTGLRNTRERLRLLFGGELPSRKTAAGPGASRWKSGCQHRCIVNAGSRTRLARLCQESTEVQVVAQSASGAAGICALREHQPDLVPLDIELQDMTGSAGQGGPDFTLRARLQARGLRVGRRR